MKFSEMSKEELVSLVEGKNVSKSGKRNGRKEEILGVLKGGIYSIKELGVKFGISNRNVSSIICYLRDDGYEFREISKSDSKGLVLWSVIRDGEKVGNRMEVGKGGKVVRFNFNFGKFDDEVSDEERKKFEEEEKKRKK